jgi:hypothetical protein
MTMKVILKHNEEKLEHAYGIDSAAFPKKMGQIIKDYLNSPNEKLSSLGDHIQDLLEPNEILYLASMTVTSKLDEMEADIEQMDNMLKKLGL